VLLLAIIDSNGMGGATRRSTAPSPSVTRGGRGRGRRHDYFSLLLPPQFFWKIFPPLLAPDDVAADLQELSSWLGLFR
jgi:hypothetical protein